MTKREIFLAGSLVCLGIFILLAVFVWKGSNANTKEMELNKQIYTKQAEDLQKVETETRASAANPANTQSAGSTNTAASTKNPTNQSNPTATENTSSPTAKSTSSSSAKSNDLFTSGCKVGDLIKLGDVEMVVTKSTARHKVIEITLKGNTSDQQPKLVLSKSNRIVYEVPADVDVNIDVTEKTAIDQSPLFDNGKEAGK
ncbi:MAG: hypothetical protein A4E53_03811 [Pelotomaculum sp. PtaB.Bin104]|nr:MAG: hypothetical protein A4E53_03811 [Pelotomaculum sp. PtaB.Bin104]